MDAEAFAMKNPPWCCPAACNRENTRASVKVHGSYLKDAPQELQQHCGVVRDEHGVVIGACQLQLAGDPSDRHQQGMPNSFSLPGEAHIEWIGTALAAQGQGVGSSILKWAVEYSQASGATLISPASRVPRRSMNAKGLLAVSQSRMRARTRSTGACRRASRRRSYSAAWGADTAAWSTLGSRSDYIPCLSDRPPTPHLSLSLSDEARNLLHHNETPLWCVARLCDPSAPLLFSMASCMEMSIHYMRPQGTCGHSDAL